MRPALSGTLTSGGGGLARPAEIRQAEIRQAEIRQAEIRQAEIRQGPAAVSPRCDGGFDKDTQLDIKTRKQDSYGTGTEIKGSKTDGN